MAETDIRFIEEADVKGKRVLVRVDFNVPLHNGYVTDDTRIREALPTINYLRRKGARVIILSHLGRPSGKGFQRPFSLAPVAVRLAQHLGKPVAMAPDITGPVAHAMADALEDGQIMMCENLRFDAREKQCDPQFCQELASMGDLFVNDGFGTAHRAHASISGVAQLLPSYAGYLLMKEVEMLHSKLNEPWHPFVAILGGSKVSDKLNIIETLIDKADTVIIGGGMCYTFLLAQGYEVGTSIREEDWVDKASEVLARAQQTGCKIMLPTDVVVANRMDEDADVATVPVNEIPHDMMGLDIGPDTAAAYAAAIEEAETVFWNGPMGVFEMTPFEDGTRTVAEAVADNKHAETIIGGGDSAAAVNMFGLADQVTFISTGGGASMAMLQGKPLPGVESLRR